MCKARRRSGTQEAALKLVSSRLPFQPEAASAGTGVTEVLEKETCTLSFGQSQLRLQTEEAKGRVQQPRFEISTVVN